MKRSEWIRNNIAMIYNGIPVQPNRTMMAFRVAENIADVLVKKMYLEND